MLTRRVDRHTDRYGAIAESDHSCETNIREQANRSEAGSNGTYHQETENRDTGTHALG